MHVKAVPLAEMIGAVSLAPEYGSQRRYRHIRGADGIAYRSFSSDALEASSSLVEVLSNLLSVLSKSSSRPRTLFVNPINSDSALTHRTNRPPDNTIHDQRPTECHVLMFTILFPGDVTHYGGDSASYARDVNVRAFLHA